MISPLFAFNCQLGHKHSLPANHVLIAMFVAHLYDNGLKYATMITYLSAISSFHKLYNLPPGHAQSHLVTKAVGHSESKAGHSSKMRTMTK